MLPVIAALLLGAQTVDSTPHRPIGQLVHQRWTAKDGVPNGVWDMAHTPDGYLWLAARVGLFSFDGVRFVAFAPQRGDSLPTGGVLRLLAARDGGLWIVWRSGIVGRYRNGQLSTYGKPQGLAPTYQVAESSSGMLIAGTANGVSRFDAATGRWRDVSKDLQYPGTQSQAVWFDSHDVLWAETEKGVAYLPAGASRFMSADMALFSRQPTTADFAESRGGEIWMAELGRGAHTLRPSGDTAPYTQVMVGTWTLLIDRKNTLWVGSAGDGLRRVANPDRYKGRDILRFGSEAEQYTTKEGLASDVVNTLHEDQEGTIWVATARDLESFREGDFTPAPTPGSTRFRSIFATRDSALWTATYAVRGVLRMSRGSREMLDSVSLYAPSRVFQDASGGVWALTLDAIRKLRGETFEVARRPPSGALDFDDFVVDDTGTIWGYHKSRGLSRFIGDSIVPVAGVSRAADPGFLHLDRQRRIWSVQKDEVACYDRGTLRKYRVADGKAPPNPSSMFEDAAGNIWLTSGEGLSKLERDGFRSISAASGVPSRFVESVAIDDAGAWWMLTLHGVLRLEPGEAERALADSSHSLRYRTFNELDGFPGTFLQNTGQHIVRTADGLIWVATDSGVASVDPRRLSARRSYAGFVEGARIDGEALVMSEVIEIPAGGRDFEIDYTATNLTRADRMRFRYRLEGHDLGWNDAGTRRRAYYNGLAPGSYTFRVSASSGDGLWDDTGAPFVFRVLPVWYQTWWFRSFAILLIGAVGAGLAAAVQRQRHVRSQQTLKGQYEATLAERARIAQDLHDTLLQGFAGVALEIKAAELALPERPDIAAETLSRVQRLTRDSLREARESVWNMRESELGSEDLPSALETCIRERTAGTSHTISVVSIGDRRRLAPALENIAYRVGREAVSNAVKHANATHINVRIEFSLDALTLEVRDNGSGLAPEQAESARRNGHFGLSGMRDRAATGGGRCDVRPSPDGGTVVTLELPLLAAAVNTADTVNAG